MDSRTLASPAFGQADLSNCEREQIQFAGSIQPHGALVVVREPDLIVVQASANAAEFLNCEDAVAGGELVGRQLQDLGGNLLERIAPVLQQQLRTIPVAVRCTLSGSAAEFDVLLHRPADGGLVLEFERSASTADLTGPIDRSLKAIISASSLRTLCDESATLFKELTGYDRVMVYRFDDEGHGEVFSERREPHLEAYLGNRYPASDIPQIARRLYERNRVRVLVDVAYDPVPVLPRISPLTDRELDMSLCWLRSMSPIHIQYLKNMGVSATLVASIMVGGKLWGLVACHHYSPRSLSYEMRAACELLAETIATRIAALESLAQAQAELSVRRLEQRMIEAISRDGDWRVALFDNSQSLLQPLAASGAALLFEGQILSTGEVPGTLQLREIAAWLDQKERVPVFATASLGFDEPEFAPLVSVASGIVATPVSSSPGEYLIWFRPERIKLVTWGGDPLKPVLIGDDPSQLSPRRSFAQWHQLVEGKSEPWSAADLTAAKLIGETVADVVLQFRSVRLLIAQDQFAHITKQVQISDLPVVIADPKGRILLHNGAFEALLPKGHQTYEFVDDLALFFEDSAEARRRLKDLIELRRTWRGEVTLLRAGLEPRSFLVRGDPVFSSPDRILGFVVLFTDIADRKAAEAAGRRFQDVIYESHREKPSGRDASTELLYQKLLASVVENAQLAALEITDGMDNVRMLQMLESVRNSVDRAAEVLDHLVSHSTRDKT
ncbi:GAF domain-containing protein [Pseudorhodoplanes sp.]|uniref:GAF domain-containing protein n=1 Tax=Pseudorhodoplanes sp. TaxID=1934341 RepID=UPI003918B32B